MLRRVTLLVARISIKFQLNFFVIIRLVFAIGALTLVVLPVRSQETQPRPSIVGLDPDVVRDLVVILGNDVGRVAGLPLKLTSDPTGKRVFLPETSGMVAVYDTESLRCIQKWTLHDERCLEVALVDQGRKLVSISVDGNACLWDITSALPARLDELKLAAKSGWVWMSPARSGDRIVFRSNGAIVIADIRDGRIVDRKRLTANDFPENLPFEFALSPDGHQGHVCNLAFLPDGDQIASVRWDHNTILWAIDPNDARRGRPPVRHLLGSRIATGRSTCCVPPAKE